MNFSNSNKAVNSIIDDGAIVDGDNARATFLPIHTVTSVMVLTKANVIVRITMYNRMEMMTMSLDFPFPTSLHLKPCTSPKQLPAVI